MKPETAWAAQWRSKNKTDGESRHLIKIVGVMQLFRTRADTKLWIEENYGYIRNRPDLQAEPHGWKLPSPVRVTIGVKETE